MIDIAKRRKELQRYAHLVQRADSPQWKRPIMQHDTDPRPRASFNTTVRGKDIRHSSSKPPRGL